MSDFKRYTQAVAELGQAQVKIEFGWVVDSLGWNHNMKFYVVVVTKVKIDVWVRVSLLFLPGGWVGGGEVRIR